MRELWNWEKCKITIRSLRGRLGFPDSPTLKFLGYTLHLEDGRIYDNLRGTIFLPDSPKCKNLPNIYHILSAYAKAKLVTETYELVTSKQLSGGKYCNVAVERAKQTIRKIFGSKPEMLCESAKLLGGFKIKFSYGDCSVKVHPLPLIPIIIVLTGEDSEFPASVELFFDKSIDNYLDLEQAGILAEVTAERLGDAYEFLKSLKNDLHTV